MRRTLLYLLFLIFIGIRCDAQNPKEENWILDPQKMTLSSFLTAVKIPGGKPFKLNIITMYDRFPEGWLKRSDIDTLISLVNSKESCNCFQNVFSSHLPLDTADIGGYAIKLIRSFQQQTQVSFGLNSCPKTNPQEAAELINWWKLQSK